MGHTEWRVIAVNLSMLMVLLCEHAFVANDSRRTRRNTAAWSYRGHSIRFDPTRCDGGDSVRQWKLIKFFHNDSISVGHVTLQLSARRSEQNGTPLPLDGELAGGRTSECIRNPVEYHSSDAVGWLWDNGQREINTFMGRRFLWTRSRGQRLAVKWFAWIGQGVDKSFCGGYLKFGAF